MTEKKDPSKLKLLRMTSGVILSEAKNLNMIIGGIKNVSTH